ncbi:MAG: GNAT family N-acetyltransferase [Chloroflexota bacterium]
MLSIRALEQGDIQEIADAFATLGWDKPASQYERYFQEQEAGERAVRVAWWVTEGSDVFAGYLTVVWQSDYPPFLEGNIPEVVDFNVLPQFRRQGIGTRLMDEAECLIAKNSTLSPPIAGIGVGMYADYGAAQRLYVKRGYIPDGRGIMYDIEPVPPGAQTVNDDSLVLFFTKVLEEKPLVYEGHSTPI